MVNYVGYKVSGKAYTVNREYDLNAKLWEMGVLVGFFFCDE